MKNPELLKVLSENEQKELERIANSDDAMNAVKKVLLFDVYFNGVMEPGKELNAHRNFAWTIVSQTPSNELAEKLKIVCEAATMVESNFRDIAEFRTPTSEEDEEETPHR